MVTNTNIMAEDTIKNEVENPQEQPQAQDTQAEEAQPKKQKNKKEDKKSEELRKQLDELSDKLAKEKDDYMRLMAEFETFRRRSSEERLNLIASAAADTIKGLLPVLDDCERAMAMLEQSSDEAAKEGTALIFNKLTEYLKTRGLERIEARGETFNTDFHEAVTQFPAPSEDLKGKVIDVILTGYTLNGKILRYAKVVVGA